MSFDASSTCRKAILQLLSSRERKKMVEDPLKINKQNLNVRSSAPAVHVSPKTEQYFQRTDQLVLDMTYHAHRRKMPLLIHNRHPSIVSCLAP